MAKGKRISSEIFGKVCSILESAKVEYGVFNAEALLDENYNGPIDLECQKDSDWPKFVEIINECQLYQEEKEKAITLFNDLYTLAEGDEENSPMKLSVFDASTIIMLIKDEEFRKEIISAWEKENSVSF